MAGKVFFSVSMSLDGFSAPESMKGLLATAPFARLQVGAPVVDPRRDHLHRTARGEHLPGLMRAVAHHQPPPVVVALVGVAGDVGVDLGLQRLGQHPPGTLPHQLVDQHHTSGARVIRSVVDPAADSAGRDDLRTAGAAGPWRVRPHTCRRAETTAAGSRTRSDRDTRSGSRTPTAVSPPVTAAECGGGQRWRRGARSVNPAARASSAVRNQTSARVRV